jgi:hypothetical protein
MERRTVMLRDSGDPVGTASLLVLIVIAGLIALFIWEPWNGTMTIRSTTVTTPYDRTSGTR